MNTFFEAPWLADLATDLPPNVRLQRLIGGLRAHFCCGAVALLRLEEEHLRPVVVDGLVSESLGRRFAVHQHPRLAAILARGEVTCFDHDSALPDPYDGLLDALVGEPAGARLHGRGAARRWPSLGRADARRPADGHV